MRFNPKNLKLTDCRRHGPDTDNELFVVEGDSAAGNVARVRDTDLQAVLPMQGKPMNAQKATEARIEANIWFKALIDALGCGIGERFTLEALRYRRILLLFDPDADGIHSGALMLLFFRRFMPTALEEGRVWMVRAPLLRITAPSLPEPVYATSEAHYQHLLGELSVKGVADVQTLRFRGLGSLEEGLLTESCVAPATRHARPMGVADADLALQYFGGGQGAV